MMKLAQRFLRWINPDDEEERMDTRHSLHMVEAHAEDLSATITGIDADALRAAIERMRKAALETE